ncbi:MAG: cellulose biosynthesis cyclic di-GMP-binding regulatory protein BcsB [Cyanobacteriota bacterium]
MNTIVKQVLRLAFIFLVLSVTFVFNNGKAFADKLNLPLKDIGADNNVELRTVKTYRDFFFTKPDNWKVLPSSRLVLSFQHSPQLLPERSSLNIMINDQVIKTIELTKANAEKTTTAIPIPPEVLKDFNKLTFDVDQHYTNECEDPFYPALWTTVLNNSAIQLDYNRVTPTIDFALFPYPIYDPLEYKPTQLYFVVPSPEENNDSSLTAMAMVDGSIAQHVGWKDLNVLAVKPDKISADKTLIIVGTPKENSAIKQFEDVLPYRVSDDKFIDSSGNTVDDDLGVLMMVPNPNNKANVIIVVSGNTPAAVLKAAKALTQNPTSKILKGSTIVIKDTLKSELAELRDWPEYIRTKKARLLDVNLPSQTVRGVTSVPIKYSLKIMPDISMPPRNFVKAKVVYSYAAHLDPSQSKLEVILNGKSYHSAKLSNVDGENLKTLELEIPTEAFNVYNELEFKFHLFPVKYDICRFTTDEHIWGTLHDTTEFDFPAQIKTVIPNMGLINDGGYPLTAYSDLQDDVFVLANDFNTYDIYAMLWTTARLAKMTRPTDAINIEVVRFNNLTAEQKGSKNLIAIGTRERNKFIESLKAELHLIYNSDGFKLIQKEGAKKLTELKDIPNMGIIEQMLNPWNDKRVVLIIYGDNNTGLLNAIDLFKKNEYFSKIEEGNIVVVAGDTVKTLITLSKEQVKQLFGEQIKRTAATWQFWWDIIKTFLIVVGILAIIRIIFGAFIKGARGQGNIP